MEKQREGYIQSGLWALVLAVWGRWAFNPLESWLPVPRIWGRWAARLPTRVPEHRPSDSLCYLWKQGKRRESLLYPTAMFHRSLYCSHCYRPKIFWMDWILKDSSGDRNLFLWKSLYKIRSMIVGTNGEIERYGEGAMKQSGVAPLAARGKRIGLNPR